MNFNSDRKFHAQLKSLTGNHHSPKTELVSELEISRVTNLSIRYLMLNSVILRVLSPNGSVFYGNLIEWINSTQLTFKSPLL
jgi:hypothetical protein